MACRLWGFRLFWATLPGSTHSTGEARRGPEALCSVALMFHGFTRWLPPKHDSTHRQRQPEPRFRRSAACQPLC